MSNKGRPDNSDCRTIHPYQWTTLQRSEFTESHNDLYSRWHSARHDVYLAERFTGRLICSVENLNPLVTGSSHSPSKTGAAAYVEPYRDPNSGCIAIPGSTLRGMVSSKVEALSGSALRVLNNKYLTVRDREKQLKHIGRIERSNDGWRMVPLGVVEQHNRIRTENASWQQGDPNRVMRVSREFVDNSSAGQPSVCWQKQSLTGGLNTGLLKFPEKGVEGTWFTLCSNLREDEDFENVHHYVWVPEPDRESRDISCFPVNGEALALFAKLLRNRLVSRTVCEKSDPDNNPPYFPLGYATGFPYSLADNKNVSDDEFVDKVVDWLDGKLIYYEESGRKVTGISFSSMWRTEFTPSFLHDGFDRKLLPWGSGKRHLNDSDYELTPAEAIFGVVHESDSSADKVRDAKLLAGRVRFSNALPVSKSDVLMDEITLRPLSSPKVPSPGLYFKADAKGRFTQPVGRKLYPPQQNLGQWVRHPDSEVSASLSLECKPIRPGTTFMFHIDVQNLSEKEFGLLIKAIVPSDTFLHSIGLGKPLGLGASRVEICGFWKRDVYRPLDFNRLSNGPYISRHDIPGTTAPVQGDRYEMEKQMQPEPSSITLSDEFVDDQVLRQLQIAGDPAQTAGRLVWYPLTRSQRSGNADDKGFLWFTENNKPKTKTHEIDVIDCEEGLKSFPIL